MGVVALAKVMLFDFLGYLLLELGCLLLVRKRQPCHAFLELKAVEEGAVRVVLKALIDLLVPEHARFPLSPRLACSRW